MIAISWTYSAQALVSVNAAGLVQVVAALQADGYRKVREHGDESVWVKDGTTPVFVFQYDTKREWLIKHLDDETEELARGSVSAILADKWSKSRPEAWA
jgi:hypothetical protein